MASIRLLRRLLALTPRARLGKAALLVTAIGSATAVRWALDPALGDRVPFATFFPADLFSALFLGWRAGAITLIVSLVVGSTAFMEPNGGFSLAGGVGSALTLYLFAGALIVATGGVLRTALERLENAYARQSALKLEMEHRLKNTLTVVQALARSMAGREDASKAFFEAFISRIGALSRAHDILSDGDWEICELPGLADRALEPFAADARVVLDRKPLQVYPESCIPLALALHELATNALKHGALSVPDGTVSVSWKVHANSGGSATVRWEERGGPPVRPPARRGMGSRLLAKQPGLDAVDLRFEAEGLICEITLTVAEPPSATHTKKSRVGADRHRLGANSQVCATRKL